MEDLQNFRTQLEQIDEKLVALLNDRCELSIKIGQWKKLRGVPVLDSNREAGVMARLKTLSRGVLPESDLEKIYQAILECSRSLQK